MTLPPAPDCLRGHDVFLQTHDWSHASLLLVNCQVAEESETILHRLRKSRVPGTQRGFDFHARVKNGNPEYYLTWIGLSWESFHPNRPEVNYHCRLGIWSCVSCQDTDGSAVDVPTIKTPVMGHDTSHILTTYLKYGPRFRPSFEYPMLKKYNMKFVTRRVIVRLRDNTIDWNSELVKCVDDKAREKLKRDELAKLAECGSDALPPDGFNTRERLSPQWLSRSVWCHIGSFRLTWEVGSSSTLLCVRGRGCEDCRRERKERRKRRSRSPSSTDSQDSDDDTNSEDEPDSEDGADADGDVDAVNDTQSRDNASSGDEAHSNDNASSGDEANANKDVDVSEVAGIVEDLATNDNAKATDPSRP